MPLIIFFTIIVMNAFASNEPLIVQHGMRKFEITLDKEILQLKEAQLLLTIKKNQCNQKLVSQFRTNVLHSLKSMDIIKPESFEKVTVRSGGKVSSFDVKSPAGQYFLSLAKQFENLKIKLKLKCQK